MGPLAVLEAPITMLAEMQRRGLVRHIGLSNGTSSIAHLRENLAVAELELPDEAIAWLGRLS